ncbi:uncharacterized protein AAG666_014168 [Megaptera novaeangliae]
MSLSPFTNIKHPPYEIATDEKSYACYFAGPRQKQGGGTRRYPEAASWCAFPFIREGDPLPLLRTGEPLVRLPGAPARAASPRAAPARRPWVSTRRAQDGARGRFPKPRSRSRRGARPRLHRRNLPVTGEEINMQRKSEPKMKLEREREWPKNLDCAGLRYCIFYKMKVCSNPDLSDKAL